MSLASYILYTFLQARSGVVISITEEGLYNVELGGAKQGTAYEDPETGSFKYSHVVESLSDDDMMPIATNGNTWILVDSVFCPSYLPGQIMEVTMSPEGLPEYTVEYEVETIGHQVSLGWEYSISESRIKYGSYTEGKALFLREGDNTYLGKVRRLDLSSGTVIVCVCCMSTMHHTQ